MPKSAHTLLLCCALSTSALAAISYPKSAATKITDDYHGTKIADPYRWLEDDNSAKTKTWVKAQNSVTRSFLDAIPQRAEIHQQLTALLNYERISPPTEYGGRWFFTRNSGLQNQAVHCTIDSLDQPFDQARVLLDPNALSADGTVSVSGTKVTEDGKLMAYSLSGSGSDWREIRVRDVATGKDLPDVLKWVKFSGISWRKDGSGFFYSRYDAPKEGASLTQKNEFQKLYFHQLGTQQEQDVLIYERKDHPQWNIRGGVSEDDRYLLIDINEGTNPKNRFFYKDLQRQDAPVIELISELEADYSFIDNDGSVFYFRTDLDAPRYRVIAIDVANPEKKNWREIIPQQADLLEGVSSVGGQWITKYLNDAKSRVLCYDYQGTLIRELALPGISSVGVRGGRRKDTQTFYSFNSYTEPGSIYRLDLTTGVSTLWRKPQVNFNGADYETKQIFYTSKDGTRVPMFIVHKKGIALDGGHRTLLYGYGGFNSSQTPGFSPARALWLQRGGILAIANIRGGGEYGAQWHEAGIRERKQNSFDDFIAAGEWLIANRYTSAKQLAIQGGSNGGLLVGACMTQRPDLFGAALPSVGVMDMLRFHRFTIGWAWSSDFGNSDDAEQFKTLLKYSPLHNLKPNTRYPATLVSTADHDDRVVPAHSFKFAAQLQAYQVKGGPPVLIRIETKAGHGAGNSLSKTIDKTADEWAFLEAVLH